MRRRDVLGGLTAAGATALAGFRPGPAAAEAPPETTTIRIGGWGGTCAASTQFAEDLLRAEGFADVKYLRPEGTGAVRERAVGAGILDFVEGFAGTAITKIDRGKGVLVLAGTHVGCFELFVHDSVRTPRDLKGKRIAVTELGTGRHIFFATLVRSIGLDIERDVTLVTDPQPEALRLCSAVSFQLGDEPKGLRRLDALATNLDAGHERHPPW